MKNELNRKTACVAVFNRQFESDYNTPGPAHEIMEVFYYDLYLVKHSGLVVDIENILEGAEKLDSCCVEHEQLTHDEVKEWAEEKGSKENLAVFTFGSGDGHGYNLDSRDDAPALEETGFKTEYYYPNPEKTEKTEKNYRKKQSRKRKPRRN